MGIKVVVVSPKLPSYGSQGEVSIGQVFETEGLKNDTLLLAPHVGYLRRLESNEEKDLDQCTCGRVFISQRDKQRHRQEVDHEVLNLDAPVKIARQRGPNGRYMPIDPDGDGRMPLETVGAQTAPPPSANAPLAADKGSVSRSDGRGGTKEVFRIDGSPPVGI